MKKRLKQTAGFTLVELIVVIAILGILAGVAVPSYSGYVNKANMQADVTLADGVATALEMAYYADPQENRVASVAITEDGMEANGEFAEKAMEAAFGANWRSQKLSYDKWPSGASATASVLDHFSSATGATAEVYKGNVHASFEDDIEDLFVEVKNVATGVFGGSAAGAEAVNDAAATTITGMSSQATADKEAATVFAEQWAEKAAWSGNISTGNMTTDNVANAAVMKARNTAVAKHVQKTLAEKGVSADQCAAIYNDIYNLTREGSSVHPDDILARRDDLATKFNTEYGLSKNTFKSAVNTYFETDAAKDDGLAYYAMMETVGVVAPDHTDPDNYWSSMEDAIGTYAQIARGNVSLNEIQGAYDIIPSGAESAIVAVLTAKDGGCSVVINPSSARAN